MSSVNLIKETEDIDRYVRLGMPEGVEPLAKGVRVLLGRIQELERALMPFARVGARPSDGKELVLVYHKDCQAAFAKLSKALAEAAAPQPEEYLPAE
jgi:hypothetical protein